MKYTSLKSKQVLKTEIKKSKRNHVKIEDGDGSCERSSIRRRKRRRRGGRRKRRRRRRRQGEKD